MRVKGGLGKGVGWRLLGRVVVGRRGGRGRGEVVKERGFGVREEREYVWVIDR